MKNYRKGGIIIMKISNKLSGILAVVLIVLSLSISTFYLTQKQGFHEDELLTYNLANSSKQLNTEGWNSAEDFNEYLTAGKHRFDYANVYKNQIIDASHPPFYYFLVHTLCSFFPNVFSKYLVYIINIVMMGLSLLLIYKIGKRVTDNNLYALIAMGGYALSIACITMTFYLRMYCSLMFFCMAFMYLTLVIYDRKKDIKALDYVLVFLTVLFGVLTQYYFILFAGLTGLVMMIFSIKEKSIKSLLIYIGASIAGFALAFAFYPYIITNVLGGNRGLGSISIDIDTVTIVTYIGYKLLTYVQILVKELFIGQTWLFVILLIAAVGFGIYLRFIKKRKLNRKCFFIIVPAVVYFSLISLVSPFNSDRYVAVSLPLISMLFSFAVIKIGELIIKEKAKIVVPALALAVSVLGIIFVKPYYVYNTSSLNDVITKDCVFVGTEVMEWNKCIDKFLKYDETMIVKTSDMSLTLASELDSFAVKRGVVTNGKIGGFIDGYIGSGEKAEDKTDSLKALKDDKKLKSLNEVTVYISRLANNKKVIDYIKKNTGFDKYALIEKDKDFEEFYNWYDYFVETESYCNVYKFYK